MSDEPTSRDLQGQKFKPVGYCIYCGSDGDRRGLREEHIMPFSLGGTATLPAASCADCEGITSYLDGVLARGVFYDYRLANKVASRTPAKKRPKTRVAVVRREGRDSTYEFEVGRHPFTTVIPLLGLPSILSGRVSPRFTFESTKAISYYYYPPNVREVTGMEPGENASIVHAGTVNLDSFARALAKIAWAHTVALGHDKAIDALPIKELVRGLNAIGPYLVGSEDDGDPPPPDKGGVSHRVKFTWNRYVNSPKEFLVCYIRLFSNAGTASNGMPTFTVFVGTRR